MFTIEERVANFHSFFKGKNFFLFSGGKAQTNLTTLVSNNCSNQAISSAICWAIWQKWFTFIWQWLQCHPSWLKHHLPYKIKFIYIGTLIIKCICYESLLIRHLNMCLFCNKGSVSVFKSTVKHTKGFNVTKSLSID